MSTAIENSAEFYQSPTVVKPWGHERIFAAGEHSYVGKVIAVNAGQSLSLQFHHDKDETMFIASGEALLEYGSHSDGLLRHEMKAGDTVHLPALVIHRITAITDLLLIEASTAALGWETDVVRLEDRYGRVGTSTA